MLKKDLGLFLLILVVGTVVAISQPALHLADQSGEYSQSRRTVRPILHRRRLCDHNRRNRPFIGSEFALFGVVFVDLLVTYHLPWILAVLILSFLGVILDCVHGFLVTRMRLQPFVVTLCGFLIYRGVARWYTDDGTAGFEFGQTFPGAGMDHHGTEATAYRILSSFFFCRAIMGVLLHRSVFGRYLFAIGKNEEAARYLRHRDQTGCIVAAYVICGALAGVSRFSCTMYTRSISPASHGNFDELYGIAAAVLGRLFVTWRRRLDHGHRARGDFASGSAKPGQSTRHPELLEFRRYGDGHPDRRACRPAIGAGKTVPRRPRKGKPARASAIGPIALRLDRELTKTLALPTTSLSALLPSAVSSSHG